MASSNSDKTVLIVEDDMILSMVLEQMVVQLGYKVVDKVKSGEEAVECALKSNPDTILMDIRLDGELDGIEAVQKIQANQYIPVIYITGNNDSKSRQRAEKTQLTDFLVKPVDQNTLERALIQAQPSAVSSNVG